MTEILTSALLGVAGMLTLATCVASSRAAKSARYVTVHVTALLDSNTAHTESTRGVKHGLVGDTWSHALYGPAVPQLMATLRAQHERGLARDT